MLLDAPAFSIVLTPESALGMISKELKKKLWDKMEFEEIQLVYTPFWIFSFDVISDGGPTPSGKAALNAFTGEVNELVPMLLEKPLKKSSKTQDGIETEIEQTAIKPNEVSNAAAVKIAAQTGLKREQVHVSAISKIYVPWYRTWVDVAGDSFKVEVDAALGIPIGLEAIPTRTKTWEEETSTALNKMKSPAGIFDLFSQLVSGITKGGGGGKDATKDGGFIQKYGILVLIVGVLLFLVVSRQGAGGSISVDCKLDEEFIQPGLLGFVGEAKIIPRVLPGGKFIASGKCFFTNSGSQSATMLVNVRLQDKDVLIVSNTTAVVDLPVSNLPREKTFDLVWNEPRENYRFVFEKLS